MTERDRSRAYELARLLYHKAQRDGGQVETLAELVLLLSGEGAPDPLRPLRDLGCEVKVTLSWRRTCSKCGVVWTGESSHPTFEEALREALEAEVGHDADPGNQARCREAQEERERG